MQELTEVVLLPATYTERLARRTLVAMLVFTPEVEGPLGILYNGKRHRIERALSRIAEDKGKSAAEVIEAEAVNWRNEAFSQEQRPYRRAVEWGFLLTGIVDAIYRYQHPSFGPQDKIYQLGPARARFLDQFWNSVGLEPANTETRDVILLTGLNSLSDNLYSNRSNRGSD